MSGEEIVQRLRKRKAASGSTGALFLISADADMLLAYIEALELAAGKTPEDKKSDTDTQAASQ